METPNYQDFQAGRESEADAALMVKFFHKEREDKSASAKEGRPIFKEVEYIEIRVPGKRDPQVCRPASDHDKQRFPRHYEMFKSRVEAPVEGTPLSEWPQMSRTMAEELSFLHIKTVEQLMAVSDTDISRVRGGLTMKQKAEAFLKYTDTTKLINEKEALEERLASQDEEIKRMQAQLSQLLAQQTPVEPAPVVVVAPDDIKEIETEAPAPRARARTKRTKA